MTTSEQRNASKMVGYTVMASGWSATAAAAGRSTSLRGVARASSDAISGAIMRWSYATSLAQTKSNGPLAASSSAVPVPHRCSTVAGRTSSAAASGLRARQAASVSPTLCSCNGNALELQNFRLLRFRARLWETVADSVHFRPA